MNENFNSIHDLLRNNRQQCLKNLSLERAQKLKKEANTTTTTPKTTTDNTKIEPAELPLVYPKKTDAKHVNTNENHDPLATHAISSVARKLFCYLSEVNSRCSSALAVEAKRSARLISNALSHIFYAIQHNAKKINTVVGKWLDRHLYHHIDSILNG